MSVAACVRGAVPREAPAGARRGVREQGLWHESDAALARSGVQQIGGFAFSPPSSGLADLLSSKTASAMAR